MIPDWRKFCRAKSGRSGEDGFTLQLETGRTQRVRVRNSGDALLLWSVVARSSVVAELREAALLAWERNRLVHLVGFRVDGKGRMVGETWLPKAGLTAGEFDYVARHLAAECDRFEFQLTGEDRE